MHLTGINVDPRQLALCRGLRPANGNRLDWREADACELPVEDASVDRVLCFEALFHFRSRRAFFAEAARVLKPGGALVGSDIVVAPAARALDVPGFRIEAALQEVFGPWPDFWSEDADHARLARAAGLRGEAPRDLTAGTLPSHRFTAPAGADAHRPTGNAARDAALMLKWLHQHGHLRYCAFRFDKP
jgi:SAM-dependent methyltransferase